jgi:hypothetical protein
LSAVGIDELSDEESEELHAQVRVFVFAFASVFDALGERKLVDVREPAVVAAAVVAAAGLTVATAVRCAVDEVTARLSELRTS